MRILFIALLVFGSTTYGQGCSDAGVCSLPALASSTANNPDSIATGYGDRIRTSLILGEGDFGITYTTVNVMYERTFSKKFSASIQIPYHWISGKIPKADKQDLHGMGDPIVSIGYKLIREKDKNLSFNLGIRLPAAQADRDFFYDKEVVIDYPMHMQPSLGTFDFLLGASYRYKTWLVGLGAQIPKDWSDNTFVHDHIDDGDELLKYPVTNQLKRAPDIVLRGEKQFRYKSVQFSGGFLGIYHIKPDQYYERKTLTFDRNNFTDIKGSDGLTLNLYGGVNFHINDNWMLITQLASPIVARDVRPAGLTRSYVATVGFEWHR